jgi:uncharacterized iron-regulated protein
VRADVVFLGEEHDSGVGHRLQLETLRALHHRGADLVLTLEQFESDVQPSLDAWLAGELDEERFLAESRPWSNYEEHYRPILLWAREEGVPVVAANIPRSLARRVSRRGWWSAAGEELAPWGLYLDEPEYRRRFLEAMGAHGGTESADLERWYQSQCLKDETMAASIAQVAGPAGSGRLVVHLCGHFHSDFGLGTVSRLQRRRPELAVAVVTMSSRDAVGQAPGAEDRERADYLWRVPEPESRAQDSSAAASSVSSASSK